MHTYQFGFGERLSDLLQDKKTDQKSLAARLGITQATVSNWITGKSEPSMKNLKQLAELFGVSIDWLVGMPPKGKEKRAASRVTGLSTEAVETLAKYYDPVSVPVRDRFITSGMFDLVTKYMEKEKFLSLQLGTFAKLSVDETIDNEEKIRSQILLLKLALLESKETRLNLSNRIMSFLDEYTNYSSIEEATEEIIRKMEAYFEEPKSQNDEDKVKIVSFDDI